MNKELERIVELNIILMQWKYEYYILDNPSIDDALYDSVEKELIALVARYPEVPADRQMCNVVGYSVDAPYEKYRRLNEMVFDVKLTDTSAMLVPKAIH